MGITRQNHYVPEWHQKRFLSSEKSAFYYLNLFPPVIDLPNEKKKKLNEVRWPSKPSLIGVNYYFSPATIKTPHF